MNLPAKDYWRVPETGEMVPLFPALSRADKESIARLGDKYEGGKAMRLLIEKTQCTEVEAKLWILYRAQVVNR